ncbi:MAG TPA: hypothetical protein ENN07_00605 [candidate division Zixibacteria bacterium]|nr:hypothetical protein [candidate division Zixibacteria bacterium]
MRNLGEYLQQMREARGITREEISKLTRIGLQYVIALEEGDYESLPPDIYVRGFIKSYGEALGADIEELLTRYESEKPKPKARRIFSGFVKESPPYESPIPQGKLGKKKIIPKKVQLSSSTLLLSAILVVAVAAIVVLISMNRDSRTTPITSVTDVVSSDSLMANGRRLASTLTREDLTQEILLKLGEINPAWAIGRADSLNLTVLARQKTWVLVETDYRRAYRGDIEPGDTLRFTAKNAFFLTMGAPNAMHLSINGFELAEWPERVHPMDLDINRGNVLQLLEGAEQLTLPRPPRPAIIGAPPPETEEAPDTGNAQPQIISRNPGLIAPPMMNSSPTTP